MVRFNVRLLKQANDFLYTLDLKTKEKVLLNIKIAQEKNDPILLKKISETIWEFRTSYMKKEIRLFAFWDKRNNQNTLVVATHGIIKKSRKTPKREIKRAENIRIHYYERNK
ncbi:MAG: addiction module toxin RelE [Marinilabiliales bacterium]|nr:MAG: addiction module toxin RelE [Marinilabiliales bacterium]